MVIKDRGGETMLTEYDKYFILFTKGHFSRYKDAEKVILGEALLLYTKDITEHHLLDYAIGVFDKLMTMGAIEGVGSDKFAWIIHEMRQIGNRLKAPTLYEWLITQIQDSKVGRISLEVDLSEIKSKMMEIAN